MSISKPPPFEAEAIQRIARALASYLAFSPEDKVRDAIRVVSFTLYASFPDSYNDDKFRDMVHDRLGELIEENRPKTGGE